MRQLALYCHALDIRQRLCYPVLCLVEVYPHQAVADIYSGRIHYLVFAVSALAAEREALHAKQHGAADERGYCEHDYHNGQSNNGYSNASAAPRLLAQFFLFRLLSFLLLPVFISHAWGTSFQLSRRISAPSERSVFSISCQPLSIRRTFSIVVLPCAAKPATARAAPALKSAAHTHAPLSVSTPLSPLPCPRSLYPRRDGRARAHGGICFQKYFLSQRLCRALR